MRNMKAILPGLIVAGSSACCSCSIRRPSTQRRRVYSPSSQKFTDCLDLIDKYYVEEVTPESSSKVPSRG
jgi:hypothetical protein